jgi:hypothetical protein
MEEGLSRSIQDSIENQTLSRMPLHGIDPLIYHIQFVDYTLMMGSPTVHESQTILSIIQAFCEASRMDINKEKS